MRCHCAGRGSTISYALSAQSVLSGPSTAVATHRPNAGDSERRWLMTLEGRLDGEGRLGVTIEGLCGKGAVADVECSDMRLRDCERSVASALFVDAR